MTNVEPAKFDAERVRAGTLPKSHQYRTFGRCGSERVCALCGAVIPKDRMEIEVEYDPESGKNSLIMHVKCFASWLGTVGGGELQYPQTSLR